MLGMGYRYRSLSCLWILSAALSLSFLVIIVTFASASTESQQQQQLHRHTSNHAVIVSSSRYWFNFRHALNALAIYDLIRKQGIPDSNIILMLADELPTNPRHPNKNHMNVNIMMDNNYNSGRNYNIDLYSQEVEIDYRGDDVTVQTMAKVLLGRHEDGETATRRLQSDEESNLLIYWTGHGGDQFFKFQDYEEITAHDISSIFRQMHSLKRYKQILFIADTCQAFTLGDYLSTTNAPNVFFVGSSLKGENSYAHHSDPTIGLSVIERYTHAILRFLNNKNLNQVSLKQGLVDHLRFEEQRAHVGYTCSSGSTSDESCNVKWDEIQMSDFFANAQQQASPMEVQEKISWNVWKKAAVQAVPVVADAGNNATETCNAQDTSSATYQGVEPSDPLFVALLMLFLGAIMISSQFV